MSSLPLGALGDLSGWVVGALLVFTGRLIPWWLYKERVSEFKAAISRLEAAVDKKDQQIAALMGRDVQR